MMAAIFGGVYAVASMVVFVVVAYLSDELHDPWGSPVPFFSGLLWPLSLPLVAATYLCRRLDSHLREQKNKTRS